MLLCLILWGGVSSAWADTATSSSMTASTSYQDLESGKLIEYKMSAPNTYSNPLRIYANNTFTFHAKSGVEKITKIEITANTNNYANDTKGATWSASGSGTCSVSTSVSNKNVTITITGTATTVTCKPSAQVRWDDVTVTYETSGGSTPVAPTITTQPQSKEYNLNATATALTIAATGTPTPTYQWYSNTTNSNENGTKIDGSTNASYTPSTATAGTFYYYCVATNEEGSAISNVATITVNDPTPASLPFSFDGGQSDIESTKGMAQNGLGSDYSASPKLKFDTQGDNVIINFNEAAKKVTYTIKGNSTSGIYAFDVMESADGISYTTVHSHTSITDATSYTDNLASASRFVKFVYTTKANGNVALGKISIVAASVLDDPELAFEQANYTFFTNDDMQVVATSSAGSAGAITYELTEGDKEAFIIDETGYIVCETAGTYTVTATIAQADGFTSGTATCSVKIKKSVVGNSIIVAEAGGSYYAMTTTCAGDYFTHKAIKKVGDKYVVSSLDGILFYTNTADGKTTIQNASDAKYVQSTAAKKVSYTEDEYVWTNVEGVLTAETATYGTLQYNTGSPRFTTYATKVGQYATIVDLSNVIVGDVVTLNAACTDGDFVYGTYSNTSAWVVPADLVVSEVCVLDGELAIYSYEEGDVVPANAGVLVSAMEGGNYNVVLTSDAATASPSGGENSLVGTGDGITATDMEKANTEFFRLTMQGGTTIGFFWGAEDGAAFDLGANKAYLAVATENLGLAGSARGGLWFNDNEQSIDTIEMNTATTIYTLNGVKVNELQKGLNIVNGKKVMVK